jgi:hypothetical protein
MLYSFLKILVAATVLYVIYLVGCRYLFGSRLRTLTIVLRVAFGAFLLLFFLRSFNYIAI